MLKIQVDEGYAYDYLAILHVKNLKFNTQSSNQIYADCFDFLKNQIDEKIHFSIIESQEYLNLIDSNMKTFEAVNKARYGEISAKQVDDLNMLRYKYKVELQNKFFSDSKITEKKS
jgi:hypothetical protein